MANKAVMHKRNDDLSWLGRAKLPAGDTFTATCSLGLPQDDAPFASLQVTVAPFGGGPDSDGYTHSLLIEHDHTGQADWPLQLVNCDVQYVRDRDGFRKSTPTFQVKIVKDYAP